MSSLDAPQAATAPKPNEPKAPPQMSTIARDGFVIVEIGTKQRKYHLHKALLTHHSEYFRGALNGPWKEATDKVVPLHDIEPETFDIFVNWMYKEKLPGSAWEWEDAVCKDDRKCDPSDDDDYITVMTKAYVFGDRFLAKEFRQAVRNHLVSYVLEDCEPAWFFAARYAFTNLREEDILLKWFVDIHCRYWTKPIEKRHIEEQNRLRLQLPSAFMSRMMDTYEEKLHQDGKDFWFEECLDPCDYHEHASEDDREACDIER